MRLHLATWRAAEAERSPTVRRQRVLARYENRVRDARTQIHNILRAFGLVADLTAPYYDLRFIAS